MKSCSIVKRLSACATVLLAFLVVWAVPILAAEPVATFSQAEKEYISSKKVLRVAVTPSWKPYSYLSDELDRSYSGYSIDLLNRICEQTGLVLELHPVESYQKAMNLRQSGSVDLNAVEFRSNEMSEPIVTIIPYLETPVQLISHKNSDLMNETKLTAATVNGISIFDFSSYKKSSITSSNYTDIKECMNAVRSLRADFAVCDQYTVLGRDTLLLTKDLTVLSLPDYTATVGFGVSDHAPPELISIVQKILHTVTSQERSAQLISHSNYDNRQSQVLVFIYEHPIELICFILSVSLACFIVLLTYTRVRMRNKQVLHGYEEGYRMLADTFGEMGLEYDYLHDCLTVFGNKCDKLDLPEVIDNFRVKLHQGTLRILLSESRFDKILDCPRSDISYDVEFQCGMRDGSLKWFRMIYIVVSTEESHRRPIRLIGCLIDVEEEYQQKEQLKARGMNDQLTGLLNRWAAEELIEANRQEDDHSYTILLIDLDWFKSLNDTHGHLCGDAALRTFAELLQEVFNEGQILCRWGGDEFLLYHNEIYDDISFNKKFSVLQKRMSLFQYNNQTIPITLSAGGFASTEKFLWNELFVKADEALYIVKNNGRDNFRIRRN